MKGKSLKKTKIFRMILASILIIVLIFVILLMLDKKFGLANIGDTIKMTLQGGETAEEFYYDSDDNSAFASVGSSFITATNSKITIFGKNGSEIVSKSIALYNPTMSCTDKMAVIYDQGGTNLAVINYNEIKYEIEAENTIISAATNRNGWLALCTQKDGYRGLVTVYNSEGSAVYQWYSGEGYLLSAAVSPNNKSLSAIVINESGSDIVRLNLNSVEESGRFVLDGGVVFEIKYIDNDNLAVITDSGAVFVDEDGKATSSFTYPQQYLCGYSMGGKNFIAIVCKEYELGTQSQIVTVDMDGEVLGVLDTESEIIAVSAAGKYLAVLYFSELVIYDRQLNKLAEFEGVAGASGVLMRTNGAAIVTGEYMATVYGI